jgi:hypothetical protein
MQCKLLNVNFRKDSQKYPFFFAHHKITLLVNITTLLATIAAVLRISNIQIKNLIKKLMQFKSNSTSLLQYSDIKEGDALSPLLFNFALEYFRIFRTVQENQMGLKLNGTHQLLVYAHHVNLLGDNIDTTKKNTQTLIDASKQVGLEVNAEKIKYEEETVNRIHKSRITMKQL